MSLLALALFGCSSSGLAEQARPDVAAPVGSFRTAVETTHLEPGGWIWYAVDVPAGATFLEATATAGSGDLYLWLEREGRIRAAARSTTVSRRAGSPGRRRGPGTCTRRRSSEPRTWR
ncbi:MAG: hypothetical protein H6734_15800 [Alphaproteobacteria bacterium]|nr:hypothetical protein [Alphaproteobacteria bacterium]